MTVRKRILIGIGVVLLLVVAGFFVWAETPASPMPEAMQALTGDNSVQVTQDHWVVFQPQGVKPSVGFIFYPGGRVDYRAYAPAAKAIAAQGFLVVITPMPLSLAVISPEEAKAVIAAYPAITHWVIGGHSLGGAMAAHYVVLHPDQINGVVFWAAYPADSDSLANKPVKVLSISATRDGLATPQKIEASRALLPKDTQWVVIPGGDHAQFGYYGPQSGDNPAEITREAQQSKTVQATVDFLKSFEAAAVP